MELLGAFESTYQPTHDVDVADSTGHIRHWREDLDLLASCGVRALRYPVRWHRIEEREGHFDWGATDRVLGRRRGRPGLLLVPQHRLLRLGLAAVPL